MKEKSPARTPSRAVLAAAIERRDAAARERRQHEEARCRAGAMLEAAEKALAGAEEAVERAKQDHAAKIADAASTGASVATAPCLTMREARVAEQNAQDDVDAARAAIAGFDAALAFGLDFFGRALDPVSIAGREVEAAAREVLRDYAGASLPALYGAFHSALDRAVEAGARIATLVSLGVVPDEHNEVIAEMQRGRGYDVPHVRAYGSVGSRRLEPRWPDGFAPDGQPLYGRTAPQAEAVQAAWQQTLIALQSNADAELPA